MKGELTEAEVNEITDAVRRACRVLGIPKEDVPRQIRLALSSASEARAAERGWALGAPGVRVEISEGGGCVSDRATSGARGRVPAASPRPSPWSATSASA